MSRNTTPETLLAAVYARYSTADQKETSVDDQVRRCREIAAKHNAVVPDELIFADAAISGSDKSRSKRIAFDQLIAAIEAGGFSLLVIDEISRLARDMYELAKFDKLISKYHVRVVTADGLDSASSTWILQSSIVGVMAQYALKEATHRVKRGMQGQLERGYMIGPPPYGYRAFQDVNEFGKSSGTHWIIHREEADIVREMFRLRSEGLSYAKIAKRLNGICVPPGSRKRKRSEKSQWLPAAVCRMLSNPIYKGIFVFHSSTTYRQQMKEEGTPVNPIEYPRPRLAVVDDEIWSICNEGRVSRSGYGGGRHEFAGLITCGQCQAVLNVTSPVHKTRCLTCASCNQEKMSGIRETTLGYVSVNGIAYMLQTLIASELNPTLENEFKQRLRERLTGGRVVELAHARDALTKAERVCKRLAESLGQISDDDPYLLAEFDKARQTRLTVEQTVKRLENAALQISTQAIEAQMAVNPVDILALLFNDSSVSVSRKRAVLTRLFPRIVLIGKRARSENIFEVDMVPGAALAELTDSSVLINTIIRRRLVLKTSARRPTVWQIEDITEAKIAALALAA